MSRFGEKKPSANNKASRFARRLKNKKATVTIWLLIWYHSLLWADSIRKGADLENPHFLFDVHPAELRNLFLLVEESRRLKSSLTQRIACQLLNFC